MVDTTATWNAELHTEIVSVISEKADGTKTKLSIVKRAVELTKGPNTIRFKVGMGKAPCKSPTKGACWTKGKCQCKSKVPVFTDARETETGAGEMNERSPFKEDRFFQAGKERKLTPTAWAAEVERLIGPDAVTRIFIQLVGEGFTG